MNKTITITILTCCLLQANVMAQSRRGLSDLTYQEKKEFRASTRQKLKELGDHISILASKSQPYLVKKKHKEETYKLFHDSGYGHYVEISFRGKRRKIPNRSYFNNLTRLNYARVEVKFTDILYLSNFYKVSDGVYTATATILQHFKGFGSDGNPSYVSRDKKTIEVTVEQKKDWWGDKRWIAMLGDISVEHTEESR